MKERLKKKEAEPLIIFSPDKKERVTLLMHQGLSKDAFPMDFFGEERAKEWFRFHKVATKENPSEEFIIPLH